MKKITFLFFCVLLVACQSKNLESSQDLPPASGDGGEILLFMDSTQWKSALGDEIRRIFSASQAGVLQDEKIFKVRWIEPTKINKFLKMHQNMLFVTTFDIETSANTKLRQFFPEEGIEKIQNNPSLFMLQKQNIYAKGQQILHLFGKDEPTLLQNLRKNTEKLRQVFAQIEEERIRQRLFKAMQPVMEEEMRAKYDIKMRIPAGYQWASKEGDAKQGFVWLRFPEAVLDKNLFFSVETYLHEKQFSPENIILRRDSLMKKYVYGNPENPESYVITEYLEKPVFDTLQINGNYAIEMRGLWKTKNISMGGSFVAYVFSKKDRLYYVEGLLYAPDLPKREHLRELSTILKMIE